MSVDIKVVFPNVYDAAKIVNYMEQIGKESDFLSFGEEGPQMTLSKEIGYIQYLQEENTKSFMLLFKKGEEIVGITTISIREDRPRMSHFGILGISILKKYWGLGYGDFLMEETLKISKERGIKKINLEVRTDNERAIKLYNKYNFEIEGKIIKNTFINNEYFDCYMMGREI